MLASVSSATLKILLFRAGPEEFPYDPGRNLTLACLGFGVLANAALLLFLMPPLAALFGGIANVGFLALFTRLTLAARKLDNRFQQTFNALVVSGAVLTLLMVPFFAKLAPVLAQIAELLAKNPELAKHPEKLPTPPSMPIMVLMMLGTWQIAVISRIFLLAGGVWTLLAFLAVLFLMIGAQLSLGA